MSSGFSNGFLVLRDLLVDALVLDGVEVPDPKSADDPTYRGSFRGYFDVPAGTHTVVGRTSAGKEHAMTVVVHPGWATVKRFDLDDGWAEDDAETELHYRQLAMSGSMQDAGALRPWPLPAPAQDPAEGTRRVFGDADFAWLRATYGACAGARESSATVQRYIDALRWHYILDSEMGVQATYFGRLGHELCEHVRARPELLATGAATYLDYFAVDLVDADEPETIEAGEKLAKALEDARRVAPAPAAERAPETAPTPAKRSGGSPLMMVALAIAVVVGVVLLLRQGSDTLPPPSKTLDASATEPAPGAAVVDLPTASKTISIFIFEANLAKATPLVAAAEDLETALAKDDCLAARRPYDAIKETKVDLTTHTALVLAQIRMLTTVAAYCNAWRNLDGKRW